MLDLLGPRGIGGKDDLDRYFRRSVHVRSPEKIPIRCERAGELLSLDQKTVIYTLLINGVSSPCRPTNTNLCTVV